MTIKIDIDRVKVSSICISNGWYKRGSISDYGTMLDMCYWAIDESDIEKIALNIFEHSSGFDMTRSIDEHISSIAFVLLNECCCFFLN